MRTKQKGQKRGTDINRLSFVDNRSSSTYTHAEIGMRMNDGVRREKKKQRKGVRKRKKDA